MGDDMTGDLTAPIDILVSEVGPRDGLQNVEAIMPVAARKQALRDALRHADPADGFLASLTSRLQGPLTRTR